MWKCENFPKTIDTSTTTKADTLPSSVVYISRIMIGKYTYTIIRNTMNNFNL